MGVLEKSWEKMKKVAKKFGGKRNLLYLCNVNESTNQLNNYSHGDFKRKIGREAC